MVASLLSGGHRLVTLVGPAGAGKTRLALRYAERDRARWQTKARGGLWFIALAEARSREDIHGAVGRALGLSDTRLDEAPLARALAGRGRMLLVLDNFEQVVEHAPSTVGAWLATAPQAQCLVTSREPLRLSGEVSLDLTSLTLPDADVADLARLARSEAGRLFLERAHADSVGVKDAPVIAQIVRRLDGLPLAIELAASRTRVLSPGQLLARLDRRFEVLAGGVRGANPRHATLETAIDWSWQLLSPAEQSALAQCTVFRGGFTLEAAEAIVELREHAGAPPPLDVIQALREKSLLQSSPPTADAGGVRLALYESTRAYAEGKPSAAAVRAAAERRHVAFYAGLGEELLARWEDAGERDALQRLTLEIDNLFAAAEHACVGPPARAAATQALQIALALEPVVASREPAGRYLTLLHAALSRAAVTGVEPALRARALVGRAQAHRLSRQWLRARADLEAALVLAEELGDAGLAGAVLWRMGSLALFQGDDEQALRRLETALAHAARAGDLRLQVNILQVLIMVHTTQARFAAALACGEQARGLARALGNPRCDAQLAGALGTLYLRMGRLGEGRRWYARALRLFRETGGDLQQAGDADGNLGTLEQQARRHREARAHFERALGVARQRGDVTLEGFALGALGGLHHERGELRAALHHYEEALRVLGGAGDLRIEGQCLARCGALAAAQGRVEEAVTLFDLAAARLGELRDPVLHAALDLHRGLLDLARSRAAAIAGDPAAALDHHVAAVARRAAAQPSPHRCDDEVRFALRLLDQAVRATSFQVARDGRWFRPPGRARVSLARRPLLARLLAGLARRQGDTPGVAVALEELLAVGWPGERVLAAAAANRLHVALTTLRQRGLKAWLSRRGDGYLLDPGVPLLLVDPGADDPRPERRPVKAVKRKRPKR